MQRQRLIREAWPRTAASLTLTAALVTGLTPTYALAESTTPTASTAQSQTSDSQADQTGAAQPQAPAGSVDGRKLSAGSTLKSETYAFSRSENATNDLVLQASAGTSGLYVEGDATLWLDAGVTLTIVGGTATQATEGGCAGIYLPAGSSLTVGGKGTLNVVGGKGGDALTSKAPTAGSVTYPDDETLKPDGLVALRAGTGGAGGQGAGGGGAAIGSDGGAGGAGGAAGSGHSLSAYGDGSSAGYNYVIQHERLGSIGGGGSAGSSGSSEVGSYAAEDSVTVNLMGGSGGAAAAASSTTGLLGIALSSASGDALDWGKHEERRHTGNVVDINLEGHGQFYGSTQISYDNGTSKAKAEGSLYITNPGETTIILGQGGPGGAGGAGSRGQGYGTGGQGGAGGGGGGGGVLSLMDTKNSNADENYAELAKTATFNSGGAGMAGAGAEEASSYGNALVDCNTLELDGLKYGRPPDICYWQNGGLNPGGGAGAPSKDAISTPVANNPISLAAARGNAAQLKARLLPILSSLDLTAYPKAAELLSRLQGF